MKNIILTLVFFLALMVVSATFSIQRSFAIDEAGKEVLKDAIIGAITGAAATEATTDSTTVAENKGGEAKKNFTVKRSKKDKSRKGSCPPGWDKGKKTGWGGKDLPPGLAKKQ